MLVQVVAVLDQLTKVQVLACQRYLKYSLGEGDACFPREWVII